MGRIRALDSEIRSGDAVHTGLIPFIAATAKTVKSCSQGGVRGGAATVHFPLWHLEFDNLVVLKNNKGVDGKNITFFSPNEVPGLYEAFCSERS
ncbi:ribonucleotide reductase of class Ia [Salmonella phage SD-6_S16]|nr:ribonucleotide reductase of class Ia [Salmonella phage SD-6_S16]